MVFIFIYENRHAILVKIFTDFLLFVSTNCKVTIIDDSITLYTQMYRRYAEHMFLRPMNYVFIKQIKTSEYMTFPKGRV